ncbi:hypothetical protein BDB00DRAFT_782944 [Zychaea mexicana]|uniref:uncharacterized protein n=1 Tax=Zychaea mexicana TaxID=64656 RepID=UPI0022FE0D94|nr:uncharacterized protein BDB00DRAFT_782944 [Zychaea mexicana]KAI9499426.1 hypothetical protein BDB00DRAFT_782944 [Zychaea mexicana]
MTGLPYEEDSQMSLRQLVRKSMASADAVVSDTELREKATSHFNTLLEQRPRKGGKEDDEGAVKLMNRLFGATAAAMESDEDKKRVALLKNYMQCLIGTTLGVDAFLPEYIEKEDEEEEDEEGEEEGQPAMSWADVAAKKSEEQETAVQRNAWCGRYEASLAAERREHARIRQMSKIYYQQQDEEPEDWGCFEPQFLPELPSETFCMPIFFPSEDSYHTFVTALKSAQETLYVCIFSMTDNTTAKALAQAKRRGVDVRIISDNEQRDAKGSDVIRLHEEEGIPYKMDSGDQFMHNKFAVIDQRMVLTGSFNWSISARYHNKENVLVTNIDSVVQAYQKEFERLWDMF